MIEAGLFAADGVSPGFTPRPWLSGTARDPRPPAGRRVAGVHAPALVERRSSLSANSQRPCVAGVHAPALVERLQARCCTRTAASVAGVHAPALVERFSGPRAHRDPRWVSPGFTPRPWLSAADGADGGVTLRRVSPGFTPRPWLSALGLLLHALLLAVSPGFTPRPWLSEPLPGEVQRQILVSPGFTPRPWLSAGTGRCAVFGRESVAGVHAPALVERAGALLHAHGCRHGVSPGFTPRPWLSVAADAGGGVADGAVSPGFTPRPWLSGSELAGASGDPHGVAGVHAPALVERGGGRTGGGRGPSVAGVHAPALVERACWRRCSRASATCRRGSRPGLG